MKNIINTLKKFLKLSIVKTIQMNIYYFGIGGGSSLYYCIKECKDNQFKWYSQN